MEDTLGTGSHILTTFIGDASCAYNAFIHGTCPILEHVRLTVYTTTITAQEVLRYFDLAQHVYVINNTCCKFVILQQREI
jgi:hypothetical protein